MIIKLGTRSSQLARIQSETVRDLLREQTEHEVTIQTIDSIGDQHPDRKIPDIGETGVFTSRLNRAILEDKIDIAVHSLKDLPTEIEPGLTMAAIPPRSTPMDMLIGIDEPDLSRIPENSVIGTSSIRRRANLLNQNPNLTVKTCRGNIPSRLEKLEDPDSEYDGLILAMAGLERLEATPSPMRMIRPSEILPAPGQGAIGIVCHEDHPQVQSALQSINHSPSNRLATAERAFLNEVEGGCQAPVGALAKTSRDQIVLQGSVTDPDGKEQISGELRGSATAPDPLGRDLAQSLLEKGAGSFIVKE